MAFYGGGPGRGGRDSIDIDFERLFGRGGGGGEPPITFQTPSWIGKVFAFGLALAVLLVLLGIADGIYTSYLWFQSLDLASVYVTRITAQIYTFLIFGAAFLVFLTINVIVARMVRKPPSVVPIEERRVPELPRNLVRVLWGLAIAVQALIMASAGGGMWQSLLKFTNASSFGISDPLLNRDVGFYVFEWPVYQQLQGWAFWALLLTLVNVAVAYGLVTDFRSLRTSRAAGIHLSIIGAGLLALIAWNYQLSIPGLLFSHRGVTAGASYTDVHAQYGAFQVLTFIAAVAAILLLANTVVRTLWLVVGSVGLWIVAGIVAGWLIPNFVQQFQVKPNELNLERPYIQNNIQATRQAFNLDKVDVQDFNVQDSVSQSAVQNAQATIKNIRLLDYRPLQTTYNQIQSIRQYYDFPDIEVDRYNINGEYQQVMLGGRELDTTRLSAAAQTWVNLHLQYTHGYGLAMSPVAEVSSEGLPDLIERDIPPQGPLKIDRPEIYYGMQTRNWVIVDTKQQEFDYPQGDQNVFATYQGNRGVLLDSIFKRLAFAWRFGDLNIVISNSLTSDSRILFDRQIQQRLQEIAPFLSYDHDPYMVVEGGKLFWIQDAYTTTDKFPYSQPFQSFNYIRNAVKIVVDAYDGTTTYYVADPTDPLIQTYEKIYPGLFRPLDQMPAELRAHIRYPEDMFLAQMDMYLTYHMTDAQVFYNREDVWALPQERFAQGAGQNRAQQSIEPYYVLMRLPGETRDEFLLLLPFTPVSKPNMISWLVARSDGADYGKLLNYKLPKDKLIYGPLQIESRIDQDTAISSQLSLWNQQGSQVLRGNLLVIPVGDSFLYVEPLYLQAQSSPLPELKRVIVAAGNKIAMTETLENSLNQIFAGTSTTPGGVVSTLPPPSAIQPSAGGSAAPSAAPPAAPGPGLTPAPSTQPAASAAPSVAAASPLPNVPPEIGTLTKDANDHYNRAQDALKSGDFTTYGQEMKQVQADLQRLNQLTGQ
ncbi:MAG TPA: UPF0182 family protein [Chloroflexota bacterium]|nr:UPF0182 family protein [Chloroflexota bacterium]